eukprot:TRINITY_DN77349_c0_g1_i1.p1 TRINITY_DN77349_c0_g1~~TRINITY_DN77349_c0_g1_i1.p1  ORF type:complete len:244 (+),score=37.37 TRINITY_DN77349_c0_g1_i1:45-776(+)
MADSQPSTPQTESEPDFESSELGTLQHWEDVYLRELDCFHDRGDTEGQYTWFGENCLTTVVDFVLDLQILPDWKILDWGTGNGAFLFKLAGERPDLRHLHAVDYSAASVALCKAVEESQFKEDQAQSRFVWNKWDFTEEDSPYTPDYFDVIHDKGTLDAISVNEAREEKQQQYKKRIVELLKPKVGTSGGYFVITSCNFTKEALLGLLQPELMYHSHFPWPVFKFGGREGSKVSTVCFQKGQH